MDRLNAGQALYRGGNILQSSDGRFYAILQASNGTLVIYWNGHGALWTSGGRDDDFLVNPVGVTPAARCQVPDRRPGVRPLSLIHI